MASRVRKRLEQFKKDLTTQTIYKEGLPGSALDIINTLLEDLAADEEETRWISVNERIQEENKAPKLASGYELGYEEGWNNCLKSIVNEPVVRIGEKTYKIPYEMQEKVLSDAEDIRNYFSRILHQGEETNENK